MDRDPIRTNIRRIRRGFGPGDTCVFCGYRNPVALIRKGTKWFRKHVARSILVRHHLVGQNHSPDLDWPVCLNCHAEAHEALFQEGVSLSREANSRARQVQRLRTLAPQFEMLAGSFRTWADEMEGGADDSRTARTHRGGRQKEKALASEKGTRASVGGHRPGLRYRNHPG